MKNKLIEYWFLLIMAVLIIVFYEVTAVFDLANPLFWLRSGFMLIVIAFSFIIALDYLEKRKRTGKSVKRKISNLEKTYGEEIKRKSKEIAELQKEKELVLQSALKQARKNEEMSEQAMKLARINERLTQKSKD